VVHGFRQGVEQFRIGMSLLVASFAVMALALIPLCLPMWKSVAEEGMPIGAE
jgi:hypothetical protein